MAGRLCLLRKSKQQTAHRIVDVTNAACRSPCGKPTAYRGCCFGFARLSLAKGFAGLPVRQASPHGKRQSRLLLSFESLYTAAMINYSEKNGRLTFKVRVVPRASRSEIVGEHDGALRVRLAAPPVDGAANQELVHLLARSFDVPQSAVEIIAGHTSKTKRVSVTGGITTVLDRLGSILN